MKTEKHSKGQIKGQRVKKKLVQFFLFQVMEKRSEIRTLLT